MAESTTLYVNATVAGGSWVSVGTAPYLNSVNVTAYIGTTSSAMSDAFTFATATSLGAPTEVALRVQVISSATSTSITAYVSDNGSTYTAFPLAVSSVWALSSVDLTAYLNSWAKVNASRVYFQLVTKNRQIYIDAASLYVTYSTAAASGAKFAALRRHSME